MVGRASAVKAIGYRLLDSIGQDSVSRFLRVLRIYRWQGSQLTAGLPFALTEAEVGSKEALSSSRLPEAEGQPGGIGNCLSVAALGC